MAQAAIILDGKLKSALSAVRSLGAGGVHVSSGAERKSAMALHSKHVRESFVYPSPKDERESFVESVRAHARALRKETGEKPCVFCFSDATLQALLERRGELEEDLTLVAASNDACMAASDKEATYALARSLSVPTIDTYDESSFGMMTFPAVVKYRHSIVWENGTTVSGSAEFVFSKRELSRSYHAITEKTGEVPLVERFIIGDEYGVEMVCDKGKPLSTFAHKRIRSLSPRGGAAVVKESAPENEATRTMRTYAEKLAAALSWDGPIMVEFKIDRMTNEVLLMEINGRFWGSLPLSAAAGVDFPMIAYSLVTGAPQKPAAFAARGARTRHFLGDCKWLFGVLFNRDPLRKLLYPSRQRALWDFTIEVFRSTGDVFSLSDPIPAVMEYIDILKIWK